MLQNAQGVSSLDSVSGDKVKQITPPQALEMLQNDKTILVDVRTEQELPDAGQPDLSAIGGESLLIPWRLTPDMRANPQFADQFQSEVKQEQTVLFLCKLGGRSHEATQLAMQLGYENSYNIIGGMDGEQGWKACNLAWGTPS